MKINYGLVIQSVESFDIRFPTSLTGDGSDAVHKDPDYSVAYVVIKAGEFRGHGMTFTLGKGTDIVIHAIDTLKAMLVNESVDEIFRSVFESLNLIP